MWGKMLDSSVWQLPKDARLLWVTMLLMKDRDGIVRAAIPGLAHRAVLTLAECEIALKLLSAPDPYSTTPTNDGRRILTIPGGWQIVNHELYRCSDELKKEQDRLRQANHRNRRKKKKPDEREGRYVKAFGDGEQAKADAIAAEGLKDACNQPCEPR